MTKADLPHVREAYETVKGDFAALGIDLWNAAAGSDPGARLAPTARLGRRLWCRRESGAPAGTAVAPAMPHR
jgi:hypothetical protein